MESRFQFSKNNNNNIIIPELLVPAGDITVLKYAIEFGADAVYLGGKKFNLRNLGSNFSLKDMVYAVDYVHKRNKKIYMTLNSIIFEKEVNEFIEYVESIKDIEFDGYIISDPGLISLMQKHIKNPRLHMSTQSNTTNHLTINHYKKLGIQRVNLAREVRYDDLREIVRNSDIEIEVFIHGALCISYSGRCMLSKYMTGRDANKGECAHSCRWKYYLMEEQRPNLFYNITQEEDGTYIYNSRDLCLLPKLDYIVSVGVHALKIEGRMKTESYVAQTVWVYRKALDLISEGKFDEKNKKMLQNEINKCSHRDYTLGFMFLDDLNELEDNDKVCVNQEFKFIGTCIKEDPRYNTFKILVKNQFKKGEIIEIVEPNKPPRNFRVNEIILIRENYEFITEEANPNDHAILKGLGIINPFSILRKKVKDE